MRQLHPGTSPWPAAVSSPNTIPPQIYLHRTDNWLIFGSFLLSTFTHETHRNFIFMTPLKPISKHNYIQHIM
jgi:hypothetical protein